MVKRYKNDNISTKPWPCASKSFKTPVSKKLEEKITLARRKRDKHKTLALGQFVRVRSKIAIGFPTYNIAEMPLTLEHWLRLQRETKEMRAVITKEIAHWQNMSRILRYSEQNQNIATSQIMIIRNLNKRLAL